MVTATVHVELPSDVWIAAVSKSHPDARFRLLTGMATDAGSIELGEVLADDAASAAAAIESHPDVGAYETLFAGDGRVLARYRTDEPSLYEFLRDASLPPEFPIVVEDGWFECDITAPRERLAGFRTALDESPLAYDVRSIVERPDPGGLLTERQRELLDAAFERGYYEIPRERTLTELAEDVGVDPSSASGVLRRAEASVVAWFLAETSVRTAERS